MKGPNTNLHFPLLQGGVFTRFTQYIYPGYFLGKVALRATDLISNEIVIQPIMMDKSHVRPPSTYKL